MGGGVKWGRRLGRPRGGGVGQARGPGGWGFGGAGWAGGRAGPDGPGEVPSPFLLPFFSFIIFLFLLSVLV